MRLIGKIRSFLYGRNGFDDLAKLSLISSIVVFFIYGFWPQGIVKVILSLVTWFLMGYAYFRKPANEMVEDEGIFCDDESKIEMIERVYKGRMLPLIVIFCCCIMPQLFMQSHNTSEMGHSLFIVFVVLFVLYLSIFVKFAYQYWKVKNRKEK
jgi:uncharacterized membrane protein YoaK (UPF0700 family)